MLKIIKLQIFCDFLHFKSRSGSASDETIRIHVALVPQHCYFVFGPPHLLAHFVFRLYRYLYSFCVGAGTGILTMITGVNVRYRSVQ
jgi:hypothetical protein